MQLIVPQETVWAWILDTVAAGSIAVVDVAIDVKWSAAIEVIGWVVVDIRHLQKVSNDVDAARMGSVDTPGH
jgi:hypothetical protein